MKYKLLGALYGLLIGDAMGVPYENKKDHEMPPANLIVDYVPPKEYIKKTRDVPPGVWSDDGAQSLCLLSSLLEKNKLDLDDFGKKLVAWQEDGYMTPNNRAFGIGKTSLVAIGRLVNGMSPQESGLSAEKDNGNGSLMRALPLALWHQGSDEELIELAHDQSKITHAHPRSQICCALYCLWAKNIIHNKISPWEFATFKLIEYYVDNKPEYLEELMTNIKPLEQHQSNGSGYVVDCLMTAKNIISTETSYVNIIKKSILIGNDTDTTACVAGGIGGLIYGIESIPRQWMEDLQGRAIVSDLAIELLTALDI